ncbi:cation transporter [Caulobacter sp. 17J65-9]|uniref:cation transporter n=1 Tax=Caulobacter sp. 17J65-9 TaxID=2709382 RepID=UPI0013C95361|nr:cation transporter [Caulobacter sp. 17J65-9]NEX91147.1 cation transporter [Caulobacter sp. 17J65-9]
MTSATCHDKPACCGGPAPVFDGTSRAFRGVLWLVVGMNAAMFAVEAVAGQLAGSMALQADALDFAGDTATYGLTLLAIGRALQFRAKAALFKGVTLAVMGIYVLGASLWRTFVEGAPEAVTMGVVGAMALAVNVAAAVMLARWRDGDANVRSVWLCSRNDAIGNVAVLAAAGVVAWTGTKWADLAVATVMAGLFLQSAVLITRQASDELRRDGWRAQRPAAQ